MQYQATGLVSDPKSVFLINRTARPLRLNILTVLNYHQLNSERFISLGNAAIAEILKLRLEWDKSVASVLGCLGG